MPETVQIRTDIRLSENGKGFAFIDVVYATRDSRLYTVRMRAIAESRFEVDPDKISFRENNQLFITREGIEILKLVAMKLNWVSVFVHLERFAHAIAKGELKNE